MGDTPARLFHGSCIIRAELKMAAGIWFHSTALCLLRKRGQASRLWRCADGAKHFRMNTLSKHQSCLQGTEAGKGKRPAALGAGAVPAASRSLPVVRHGAKRMPGALPSTQLPALGSRANERGAKEGSRNFILHLNL